MSHYQSEQWAIIVELYSLCNFMVTEKKRIVGTFLVLEKSHSRMHTNIMILKLRDNVDIERDNVEHVDIEVWGHGSY